MSSRQSSCVQKCCGESKHRRSERTNVRCMQLTISRLRAYGEKWKLWCNKNRHTGLKSIIPVDKRDRTVIEQDMEGDYQLHPILIQEFTRIQQEISRKKA